MPGILCVHLCAFADNSSSPSACQPQKPIFRENFSECHRAVWISLLKYSLDHPTYKAFFFLPVLYTLLLLSLLYVCMYISFYLKFSCHFIGQTIHSKHKTCYSTKSSVLSLYSRGQAFFPRHPLFPSSCGPPKRRSLQVQLHESPAKVSVLYKWTHTIVTIQALTFFT